MDLVAIYNRQPTIYSSSLFFRLARARPPMNRGTAIVPADIGIGIDLGIYVIDVPDLESAEEQAICFKGTHRRLFGYYFLLS